MPPILSIDIGTSKCCVILTDPETRECPVARSCPNTSDVKGLPPDRHEQSPEIIIELIRKLIIELVQEHPNIAKRIGGIAISGQMHGLLLVDEKGQSVSNLITWRDQRALDILGLLDQVNTGANLTCTGTSLHPGYGGATLAWLNMHELVSGKSLALSMADYLALVLTGRAATESTHAASWGLLDLKKNEWCSTLTEQLGIPPEQLPPIRRSAERLGEIKPDVADDLGLRRGIPVFSPVGDNQASVIGTAGFERNQLVFNLGTGGQISIPQPGYKVVEGFETRPMPHGGSILVGASLCGGWSYTYLCSFVRDLLREVGGVELSPKEVFDRMDILAARTDTACGELKVDTRFAGTRGDPEQRGSIQNIDTTNFTISNLARAFMEGMVLELARLANRVDTSAISTVLACGNGVRKNPLMIEIIEKVFQKKVELACVQEEASVGAARAVARTIALARGER